MYLEILVNRNKEDYCAVNNHILLFSISEFLKLDNVTYMLLPLSKTGGKLGVNA